jgi:hypothetical protein
MIRLVHYTHIGILLFFVVDCAKSVRCRCSKTSKTFKVFPIAKPSHIYTFSIGWVDKSSCLSKNYKDEVILAFSGNGTKMHWQPHLSRFVSASFHIASNALATSSLPGASGPSGLTLVKNIQSDNTDAKQNCWAYSLIHPSAKHKHYHAIVLPIPSRHGKLCSPPALFYVAKAEGENVPWLEGDLDS